MLNFKIFFIILCSLLYKLLLNNSLTHPNIVIVGVISMCISILFYLLDINTIIIR